MSNVIPLYPLATAKRPPLLWRLGRALAVSVYMVARACVLVPWAVVSWVCWAAWTVTRIAVTYGAIIAALLLAFALTPPILWPLLFVLLLILQTLKRGRA